MTNQFLASSLSFRDQAMTKEQSRTMLRLNKSAVFITSLTLVYVPASYMATFFGMNFFYQDEDSEHIAMDPMVWIYVVSTILLSGLTFVFYYMILHIDSTGIQKYRAKMTQDAEQLRARLWRVSSMQAEKSGSIA
jgi:RsiW-degrading membrane proteinase PrsW (M82 family)